MKSVIIFAAVATTIFASINGEHEDFKFQLLEPRGFRVSFKPAFEVFNVTLNGIINESKKGTLVGRFVESTGIRRTGWFVYQNTNIPANPGHTVYFWAHIRFPNAKPYTTAVRTYIVPNATRVLAN